MLDDHLDTEVPPNSLQGVVLIQDSENTIIFADHGIGVLYGYQPKELCNKHYSLLFHDSASDSVKILTDIKHTLDKLGSWHSNIASKRKDGTCFNITINISIFSHQEYGKIWVASHRQTTEKDRENKSFPLPNETYRTLFEQMKLGVYCLRSDGSLTDINQIGLDLLGFSQKQFLKLNSNNLQEMFARESDSSLTTDIYPAKIALSSGKSCHDQQLSYTNPVTMKKTWLLMTAIPLYKRNEQKPDQVIVIIKDLNWIKHRERKLDFINAELKGKLQYKEEELIRKNIALSEILNQLEVEKQNLAMKVNTNVQSLLLPIIKKAREKATSIDDRYLQMLEQNLAGLTSPFSLKIAGRRYNLTPKEIEICGFIKNGFTGKEIANLLNLSERTVETHRFNIRKKIGISSKKVNLASHLASL